MKRYVIALDREVAGPADARKLLDRPPTSFVNACEYLAREGKGLRPDLALEFPDLGVTSAELSDDEVRALRADPRVRSVRESREVTGSPVGAPLADAQLEAFVGGILPWHVRLVNADRCWPRTTGRGVKVGVIDSEIDRDLPDLPIVSGRSFHPEAADWFGTEDPHGTFCAAIIGCRATNGTMVGIAPDCELYALRVNKNEQGNSLYIAAAMEWAASERLDVVSLSQWDPDGAATEDEAPWDDVGPAAQKLTEAGCIVIGIAGNSGSFDPNHWVTNPGRCSDVVAVGATNSDSTWWGNSSFGPDHLAENTAVEIAAPGKDILSLGPHGVLRRGSGTSFAAPQVAGACALLKEVRPDLAPAEILAILKRSVRDLGPAGRDAKFGAGMLDCYQAISQV